MSFDKNSDMYKKVTAMTENFAKNANASYINGISDIGGSFDILAALRGTETLLYDLMDSPKEVIKAVEIIEQAWFEMYDRLYIIINQYQVGITNWMPLWSEKKWYPLQCDFSAMISPAMFEEFVKPSLKKEAAYLGRSIYHLDGKDATRHLDHLLDIDEINGIQWSPGAGQPDVSHETWFPMYKKILGNNKRLVLMGADIREVPKLFNNIGKNGVYVSCTASSVNEAQELINYLNVNKRSV